MYYKKIDEFVNKLNKNNIEESKPLLIKYVIQLILRIKEDDDISLEDLKDVLKLILMREEFKDEVEKDLRSENSEFRFLTDEFINTYKIFINEIAERGYLHNAIHALFYICIFRRINILRNIYGKPY